MAIYSRLNPSSVSRDRNQRCELGVDCVGVSRRKIFGFEVLRSGFHEMLADSVQENGSNAPLDVDDDLMARARHHLQLNLLLQEGDAPKLLRTNAIVRTACPMASDAR